MSNVYLDFYRGRVMHIDLEIKINKVLKIWKMHESKYIM